MQEHLPFGRSYTPTCLFRDEVGLKFIKFWMYVPREFLVALSKDNP